MGIERARVVEVYAPASATGRVGSGYLVGDRLVLTAAGVVDRRGPTEVRPGGTVRWLPASLLWSGGGEAAILEVDDPSALTVSPAPVRWGEVVGNQPVPVTGMAFPPAQARPGSFRDTQQFFASLVPCRSGGSASLPVAVSAGLPAGNGMLGAALLAGAELVGVVVDGPGPRRPDDLQAVPASALAGDDAFARLLGGESGLVLTPVSAPSYGFPILPGR